MQLLETINLDLITVEIPAKRAHVAEEIYSLLDDGPLRYEDAAAFRANNFTAGFGLPGDWGRLGTVLGEAGARKAQTVSLLLQDGGFGDMTVAAFDHERTLFHIGAEGLLEGITVGPGRLVLRVKADLIPGSKGLCRVAAVPVFMPAPVGFCSGAGGHAVPEEVFFGSTGLSAKLRPGHFILLGSTDGSGGQLMLDGLLFRSLGGKSLLRVVFVVCADIVD
jgi:hypothetical protein